MGLTAPAPRLPLPYPYPATGSTRLIACEAMLADWLIVVDDGYSTCVLLECRDFTESRMRVSNIGTVLRDEISRLSRKEIRSQAAPIKKIAAKTRRDVAALKREVASLERHVTLLLRKNASSRPEVSPEATTKPIRFSAKRLQAQRGRLGLSAIDFGSLLGVSAQTIYNWEHEVARPRGEQLGKLAAIRGIGKREAGERLKQLATANR